MTYSVQSFVGSSGFIKEIRKIILSVCQNTASVLITGETGTGKQLFARVVHIEGKKNPSDFLELNCKLFYTQGEKILNSINKFVSDDNNREKTIYVSNIEKLNLNQQEKLCTLLKDDTVKSAKVRFIFSSTENLEELMEAQRFSKDLYFQISNVFVNMIPLRQHKEDIPEIADYYYKYYNKIYGKEFLGFSETAKNYIMNYFWGGNVAELKNAIERCFIVGHSDYIRVNDMALGEGESIKDTVNDVLETSFADKTLKTAIDSFKREYLIKILEENNWNQTKTAKVLGIQRTYVIRLINELQIRK